MFLDRAQVIAHRDDVPKRGVDGIELRLFAMVGEAVGQHAFRYDPGPLHKDVARILQAAGREAEPADGDEGVAPPVAEPRVTRDDGFAGAAPNEISIRRPLERRGKAAAPVPFHGAGVEITCLDRLDMIEEMPFRRQHQDGGFMSEIELENPRRSAIFERVQTARLFFAVEEIAIPGRLLAIGAVAESDDPRKSIVGMPNAALAVVLGVETKGAVLMMGGMEIAPGEKRPNEKFCRFVRRIHDAPGQEDGRLSWSHEEFLFNRQFVR